MENQETKIQENVIAPIVKPIEDKKPKTTNKKVVEPIEEADIFVNPFETGVNYKQFLEAIPEDSTVEKYCKGKLTDEQIEFLTNDLKHYKNNLK